jgi:hypothetical protein
MKKIFVIVLSMTVVIAASAQYKGGVYNWGGQGTIALTHG